MLDERGQKNLVGVHPTLALAVTRAMSRDPKRRTIVPGGGVRSRAQAASNALAKTGVLDSLHCIQSDGWSHAVDVLPTGPKGEPVWDAKQAPEINDLILEEADNLDFPLQEGADWDLDGIRFEKGEWDAHHLQIPRPWKMREARAAMERRKEARKHCSKEQD